MRNAFVLGLIGIGFAGVAVAQGGPSPSAPFVTHQLAPNVSWVEGGGGNSTVIVGNTGVIVIDAKTSAAGGKELLDDVAKITPKPVKTVILTHSDGDHVNGLASFPTGLTIIADEGNKAEQEAALKAGGRGAPPADHLPTQVVTGKGEDVTIDGVKLRLLHWAPAHTSGDLVIFIPAWKLVIAGDILTGNMPDPLIHLEKNGSSAGWIETVKGMVALPADQYLTGHGAVLSKADVEQKLAAVEAKRAKIAALVKEGKSLDEIKVAVGDPAPAQGGQPGRPNFPTFTEVVYKELTK
jgi:cyclase